MKYIQEISDSPLLRATWQRVFSKNDPFCFPFSSGIESQMLFFPTKGYHLSQFQYQAVLNAAKSIGDTEFWLSIIEFDGDHFSRGDHWCCQFPCHKDYLKIPLVLENAFYSPSGRWGILVSHEDHAIVGGEQKFISNVKSRYAYWETDLLRLTEKWKDSPNNDWLTKLLLKIHNE